MKIQPGVIVYVFRRVQDVRPFRVSVFRWMRNLNWCENMGERGAEVYIEMVETHGSIHMLRILPWLSFICRVHNHNIIIDIIYIYLNHIKCLTRTILMFIQLYDGTGAVRPLILNARDLFPFSLRLWRRFSRVRQLFLNLQRLRNVNEYVGHHSSQTSLTFYTAIRTQTQPVIFSSVHIFTISRNYFLFF